MTTYEEFLNQKTQLGGEHGFEPVWMTGKAFDFQKHLIEWNCRKGRSADFADCGLGKTLIQTNWAENITRKTNKRTLILTPLAVGQQTVKEGAKFEVECYRSRDGKFPSTAKIIVSNYEKLQLFDPNDFEAMVCDESSILKNYSGETRKYVTRFMLKLPYRLLCTATAAPNDFVELGTSSEALGELSNSDMLARFFVLSEKVPHRMQQIKNEKGADGYKEWQGREGLGNHFGKLSFRVTQNLNKWLIKGHAKEAYWKWVCSWARACRKPSDLGYDDSTFRLPPINERHHVVEPLSPPTGEMFTMPAIGLSAERDERRRTMKERCEKVAELVSHGRPFLVWCHLNTEGDLLEDLLPNAIQVKGAMSDDEKEESYAAFESGQSLGLICKPKIGAWGLNWQHCAHVVSFASHSYEQYYQGLRRCWRFGQKNPVQSDIVSTTGEAYVQENMVRKARQADEMFGELVRLMNDEMKVQSKTYKPSKIKQPKWNTKSPTNSQHTTAIASKS